MRLSFLLPLTVAAASASAQTARLDSIAGFAVNSNRAVGTVVAVVQGNQTLLMKGYGKADVEWNIPMPVDAMFEMGSITKQFTAAAILKLRDEGKLSLDDELTKWLPDFDTRGNKVTLRHLLGHTSGIHDLTETVEFRTLVSNRAWPRDSAYALIKRYPFDFPTGTMQMYSNSGFWLLGLVVEKASGMSYKDYVEKNIFAPAGMKHSMICDSYANIEHRAHGYGITRNGQIQRAPSNIHTWPFAAGSVCSTAADMVTWLQALHGGKVLSPKSYAEMTSPSKLDDGTPLRYGMGLGVGKDDNGLMHFWHGGTIAGFNTEASWYPETKTGVVVLSNNNGGIDPEEIAEDLAGAVIPHAAPAVPAFTGDATPFIGKFKGRGANGELTVEITKDPQGLLVSGNGSPPRPLNWLGDRSFLFNNFHLTFRADGNLGFNPAKGLYTILKRQ